MSIQLTSNLLPLSTSSLLLSSSRFSSPVHYPLEMGGGSRRKYLGKKKKNNEGKRQPCPASGWHGGQQKLFSIESSSYTFALLSFFSFIYFSLLVERSLSSSALSVPFSWLPDDTRNQHVCSKVTSSVSICSKDRGIYSLRVLVTYVWTKSWCVRMDCRKSYCWKCHYIPTYESHLTGSARSLHR